MHTIFSISIVSHGHAKYIQRLMRHLACFNRRDFDVILTLNFPEELSLDFSALPYAVTVINNDFRKGFAENHNAAFAISRGDNFVIMNPDVDFIDDPFDFMISMLASNPEVICAPSIVNASGMLEDSMRKFPTPLFLIRKLVGKLCGLKLRPDSIEKHGDVLMPDWVAGMFIVVPRIVYANLNGLSEDYHMYYEDVDFCARARLAGYPILVSASAKVIHEAQRDSHRKFRYLLWHLQSAIKFFTSKAYVKIRMQRMFDTSVGK